MKSICFPPPAFCFLPSGFYRLRTGLKGAGLAFFAGMPAQDKMSLPTRKEKQ